MEPETMKVQPWGEDQGDYVLINAGDFDPKVHKKFGAESGGSPSAPRLETALPLEALKVPAKAAPKKRRRRKVRK